MQQVQLSVTMIFCHTLNHHNASAPTSLLQQPVRWFINEALFEQSHSPFPCLLKTVGQSSLKIRFEKESDLNQPKNLVVILISFKPFSHSQEFNSNIGTVLLKVLSTTVPCVSAEGGSLIEAVHVNTKDSSKITSPLDPIQLVMITRAHSPLNEKRVCFHTSASQLMHCV